MASRAAQREHLAGLIEPLVTGEGFDLEDVAVSQAGRRSLVRVVVDNDHGVSLDDIAKLSRTISSTLDENDGVMGGVVGAAPYTLEVTSPGVDRPLTEPRHWRRSVGRLVKVELVDQHTVEGRVVAAEADEAVLDTGRVPYADIKKAKVQVEFKKHPDATGMKEAP